MRTNNISITEIVICAIVVIIGGSFGLKGLAISIMLVGAYILCAHFNQAIMAGIHAVLQQVPLTWLVVAWAVLTVIAIIGSITYSTSGIQARFINTPVYLVSLVLTVLYMLRRVPESGFFRFCAFVWSLMTLASIWKLVPFVGWILAIANIVLFLELHHIADRTHQPQQQQRQRQQHNGGNVITNLTDHSIRNSVETVSTGRIQWNFYPKNDSGQVCSFMPLTWCHIPAFWRHITFVKNGREILVEDKVWCHLKSRTNLGLVYDPDFAEGSEEWLISFICRNMQIRLIRGGTTKDGKHESVLRFRLPNDEADSVLACIDILIQETCDFQGLKRLGRI